MNQRIFGRKITSSGLAATLLLLLSFFGLYAIPANAKPQSTVIVPASVRLSGIDLHDGQMVKAGDTYYLYGTEYGCGYRWYQANTPWCGFGVSTSSSMNGPWSSPQLLFPANTADPYNPGKTYQNTCGDTGQGCFQPRMIQRTGWGANDGVWVLWFNAPWYVSHGGAPHAYMTMGCNGPAGPCGVAAGAPYGSTYRPVLHQCSGANGDADLSASVENNSLTLFCPMTGNTALGEEQIDKWGTNGTGTGSTSVAGLSHVEGTGVWKDTATGTWVLTYSEGCGYCTGVGTGYATARSVLGPWTDPVNLGFGQPVYGRRDFSAGSCGGQADTVSVMDGQPWQEIDTWTGQDNETNGGLLFAPLEYSAAHGMAGDGGPWVPAVSDFTCI